MPGGTILTRLSRLFAVCLFGLAPLPAAAHPHAWIDLRVEVLFDPAGRVTALRQTWLFDEYYTAFATEGFDKNRDGQPDRDKLDALLAENLGNLAQYDTFTRVRAGGGAVAVGKPGEASSRMVGNRLEMTFSLPLKAPVAVGEGIDYAVFDPTFYIEILHAEKGEQVRLVGAPASCAHEVVAPSPSIETVALAQGLDRTQSAGDGLGAHFAEWVEIRCRR
ncbi:MAG: DUF1007 family protein [Pseudomonadota bacterium]